MTTKCVLQFAVVYIWVCSGKNRRRHLETVFGKLHIIQIPASVLPIKTLQVQACILQYNVNKSNQERDICAELSWSFQMVLNITSQQEE